MDLIQVISIYSKLLCLKSWFFPFICLFWYSWIVFTVFLSWWETRILSKANLPFKEQFEQLITMSTDTLSQYPLAMTPDSPPNWEEHHKNLFTALSSTCALASTLNLLSSCPSVVKAGNDSKSCCCQAWELTSKSGHHSQRVAENHSYEWPHWN